jgi:hypothetical protein
MKRSDQDFTRTRKLPFARLIIFLLSLSGSGKSKGVDTLSGDFFRAARRSRLWPYAAPVHRSALTKARAKVPWTVFRVLLLRAVALAYKLWPREDGFFWHKMSVFAIDGSKVALPATKELREHFDPGSGLDKAGKGHFPQCLASTAFDVFRRLIVARSVGSIHDSEREQAKELLPMIPSGNVVLFDRGYPSYGFISYLKERYDGYFLLRCPASCTFPAVETFVRGGKKEGFVVIRPSKKYWEKLPAKRRKRAARIQLRILKLVKPDGSCSVLLTNLLNQNQFPSRQIMDLYLRRWAIESHYRDEKVVLEIEKFHGKSANSIRQELFAVAVMAVIARTLMAISFGQSSPGELQFKHTIMTLASEAAVLVPEDPRRAAHIFREILDEISRVQYYRPKVPKPSQPRATKKPPNKWCFDRRKKLEKA